MSQGFRKIAGLTRHPDSSILTGVEPSAGEATLQVHSGSNRIILLFTTLC
jgi:hypothetical protein